MSSTSAVSGFKQFESALYLVLVTINLILKNAKKSFDCNIECNMNAKMQIF